MNSTSKSWSNAAHFAREPPWNLHRQRGFQEPRGVELIKLLQSTQDSTPGIRRPTAPGAPQFTYTLFRNETLGPQVLCFGIHVWEKTCLKQKIHGLWRANKKKKWQPRSPNLVFARRWIQPWIYCQIRTYPLRTSTHWNWGHSQYLWGKKCWSETETESFKDHGVDFQESSCVHLKSFEFQPAWSS